MPVPTEFHLATVKTKANVYFNGGVVSHTLLLPGLVRTTLGLIRPGRYHFNTDAAERMDIIAGGCQVTLDGGATPAAFGPGSSFDVPAKSGFEIVVEDGLCEYVCTFKS